MAKVSITIDKEQFDEVMAQMMELKSMINELNDLIDVHWFTKFIMWFIRKTRRG